MVDRAEILKQIAGEVAVCKNCQLSFSRKRSVPGEGPDDAEVMLIGEGPGFYENEHGRPFVGAAGKFLDELLQKAGLNRETVFITNVVKCRPPANRDPLPDELIACNKFLERQIETINPKVIVTLGRFSMGKFLPGARISSIHGQASWVNGRLIVPMFHPAAALHQPSLKGAVYEDFTKLPGFIAMVKNEGKESPAKSVEPEEIQPKPVLETAKPDEQKDEPTQLSLF